MPYALKEKLQKSKCLEIKRETYRNTKIVIFGKNELIKLDFSVK